MALPDMTPMPPSLAADTPDAEPELEALFDSAVADALDTGAKVETALDLLASSEDAPRWRVTDLGSAEWAMRHVASADRRIAELEAQREDWTSRISAWFDQASSKERARRAFFSAHLEAFARSERATGGAKTVTLPSGTVATRESPAVAEIVEESDVLAWADKAGWADEVSVRKVSVSGFRSVTEVVEVVDAAELVLESGSYAWRRVGYDHDLPAGSFVEGDECPTPGPWEGHDPITAVHVDASHREVRDEDGSVVPGTTVRAPRVTATVKAVQ